MTLVIHPDQTTKQPVVWRCLSDECKTDAPWFEFESDQPRCPKCGSDGAPTVQKRVLIHLAIRNSRGPILGFKGERYAFACDPPRELLATMTNGEAISGQLNVVNCPSCLMAITKLNVKDDTGRAANL